RAPFVLVVALLGLELDLEFLDLHAAGDQEFLDADRRRPFVDGTGLVVADAELVLVGRDDQALLRQAIEGIALPEQNGVADVVERSLPPSRVVRWRRQHRYHKEMQGVWRLLGLVIAVAHRGREPAVVPSAGAAATTLLPAHHHNSGKYNRHQEREDRAHDGKSTEPRSIGRTTL